MTRGRWLGMCVGAGLLGACGGGKVAQAPEPGASAGSEAPEGASRDDLSVTGLRGTLSQSEIQNALEPRMPKFARCVQQRNADLEWLSGEVALEFRVNLDGSVGSVYPRASSLGDRAAERCITELAAATRFPPPHGGEADFSWPLEVPLDDGVREPVALGDEHVSAVVEQNRALIDATCGAGAYTVTAYLDPNGSVVTAGVAAGDAPSALNLDCVADAVEDFVFESPGSYVGKVRFSLP